jgi:hypothetical protein
MILFHFLLFLIDFDTQISTLEEKVFFYVPLSQKLGKGKLRVKQRV